MNQKIEWPDGAKFAFSIFDDTDNATVENCKPIYDYLTQKGILTTKSVWVYQPRGKYFGDSLSFPPYLEWVKELDSDGVEIGLHNVGDGRFSRKEILAGLNKFEECLGKTASIHCNHVSNLDNLYWWDKRFVWPINILYKLAYFFKRRTSTPKGGDDPESQAFWGDVAKNKIKYVRNLTFSDINTLNRDPKMPWHDPAKPYVNFWFSSSDGHDARLFNDLLATENLDKLEQERGACIVYTHFASGFIDEDGNLDPVFKARIDDLASRGGWFVPCSELLDYLLAQKETDRVSYWYRLTRNITWAMERIEKTIKYRM